MKQSTMTAMSKDLVTINENYSLESAYNTMTNYNIRHLPVINDFSQIVGVLSERDLQRAMRSRLTQMSDYKIESTDFDPKAKVKDYMTWPVQSVEKTESLKDVANRMIEGKFSSVLVREETQVVGIITTEDCLRALVDLLDDSDGLMMTVEKVMYNPIVMGSINSANQVGI